MNSQADPLLPDPSERLRHKHNFTALLFRAIWIIPVLTLLIYLIFLSLGHIQLSQSGMMIAISLVYTAFIALPSIFLLNWVAHRYAEEYPRSVVLMQALVLVCTATIGCLAGGLVFKVTGIVRCSAYWSQFREDLPFSIVIALVIGLSISSYEALGNKLQAATLELRTRQVEQERACKLLAEARLSSLESRIRPHFLFNTLNSIAALIPLDPVRAEATVGNLASLLRFSLNAGQSGLIPLSQELKIVRDYLEIEKTRFSERLRYEITVPSSLEEMKIPPLSLQSLVENSVKHVISQRPEGGAILITGSQDSGCIRLEVLDDGPGFSLDAIRPEHGLGNLVARIESFYGDAGKLEVTRESGRTAVRLILPA